MFKICGTCEVNKPTSAFYSKKGIPVHTCKVCACTKAKQKRSAVKAGTHVDKTSLAARSLDFKVQATKRHGGKFSYDGIVYVDRFKKVKIFCTEHGQAFLQAPLDHLEGGGCRQCNFENKSAARRLSNEVFIERARASSDQAYDYSRVQYVNNTTDVLIGCKTHGFFEITPAHHIRGQGCPACSRERASKRFTMSLDTFISRSVEAHSDKYDYTETVYTGIQAPLIIRCKKCNLDFEQTPANHLQGCGCPTCGKERGDASLALTRDEFIQRSVEKHGDLYDYHDSKYVKAAEPVTIFCNRHGGYFEQLAGSHMQGLGCASCAPTGYSTNKPGTLYMLSCGDITKVGITNFTPEVRAYSVSKSYGAEFSVVRKWVFEQGAVADKVETIILRTLRKMYSRPASRFQGSSECFLNVDRLWLVREIESEISNQEALV